MELNEDEKITLTDVVKSLMVGAITDLFTRSEASVDALGIWSVTVPMDAPPEIAVQVAGTMIAVERFEREGVNPRFGLTCELDTEGGRAIFREVRP